MHDAREIDLSGAVAVVTGGESGIGAACAIRLANAGAAVSITYFHDLAAAKSTVHAIEAIGG